MSLQLYEHQNMALPILRRMERQGRGGFLCDGMGMGKCLHPDTKVLLWKGGYKLAKDIIQGDLLIGDNSSPRTVLSTCTGTEMMYTIQQHKGENYTVNESHILSLKISGHKGWYWYQNKKQYIVNWFDQKEKRFRSKCFGPNYGSPKDSKNAMMNFMSTIPDKDIIDLTVKEYLSLNKSTRAVLKGFKVGVDFPEQKIHIDPYVLGAWLGDGGKRGHSFHNIDDECLSYFQASMNEIGCELIQTDDVSHRISGITRGENLFLKRLDHYNLRNNKHIPVEYLNNSRKVRMQVLAGLIDTDGYLVDKCYEITQKRRKLSEDIAYLARSLGFFVLFREVKKSCMYKGKKKEGIYYKCVISGKGTNIIPVLISRKKCDARKQKKDVMVTNITIKQVGVGKYCGFTIDGNRRFLLNDFTVTHNTVTMATHLARNKISGKKDLIVCPLSLMNQWKKEVKRVYKASELPKPKILLFHGPNRMEKLGRKKWDFIITTYSIIGSGQLNKKKWGRVVLDESHYIKNGLRSKKTKCAVAAFEIGKRSKYNWCVTGTPFCNSMSDIASQCKFVGTRPYNDPAWWKSKSGGLDQDNVTVWRERFVLRRTKENILAPPQYHDIEVIPTKQETKLTETLRSEAQKKFERWKRAKGLSKITLQGQILGLIQRLRIVSDSYYCGEQNINIDQVSRDNAKVDKMVELLDQKLWLDPSKAVVVFSQFTSYLDLLKRVIEEDMVGVEVLKFTGGMNQRERSDVVEKFTTSKHPRILLISLLAGGCGLNLMPCATVFLSEPYYNPFVEKQAEERVHRLGQKNQVNVYRFSMANSVETWINGLKQKKLYMASGLDLLCKHDATPAEFSFEDLADLFVDLVGFRKNDEKKKRKKKPKPPVPQNIGIDCVICLEDCLTKRACNLACGHIFHVKCLNTWRRINDSCPLCKRPVQII